MPGIIEDIYDICDENTVGVFSEDYTIHRYTCMLNNTRTLREKKHL